MSTESIVNRVNNTFLENELKKIEPPAQPEVDTTPAIEAKTEYGVPPHVGETVALQPEQTAVYADHDEQYLKPAGDLANREAFDELAHTLSLRGPELTFEQSGQSQLHVDENLLASFRALVGGEDFKVFRSQVIRAFKHQGVDTKRFFGE